MLIRWLRKPRACMFSQPFRTTPDTNDARFRALLYYSCVESTRKLVNFPILAPVHRFVNYSQCEIRNNVCVPKPRYVHCHELSRCCRRFVCTSLSLMRYVHKMGNVHASLKTAVTQRHQPLYLHKFYMLKRSLFMLWILSSITQISRNKNVKRNKDRRTEKKNLFRTISLSKLQEYHIIRSMRMFFFFFLDYLLPNSYLCESFSSAGCSGFRFVRFLHSIRWYCLLFSLDILFVVLFRC